MMDNFYSDFLEETSIPKEDRAFCKSCKQWIPKSNLIHTCYDADIVEGARFKFNSGMGALLCSACNVILKIRNQMNKKEKRALLGEIKLGPYYCEKCKVKRKSNG